MEIREIHENMIGAVKQFLADREGFRDSNGWQGLFNYPWKLPAYPYGYALSEGDEIRAFVGTIFSERIIAGKTQICCNMNTWYVPEEYRHHMLALKVLKPMINMNDILITALTPGDLTVTVLQRLGFKLLDEEQIAVPVIPRMMPVFRKSRPLVLFDDPSIKEYLDPENLKIFKDHSTLDCKHFLIRENDSNRFCYGIATTSRLRKLPFQGHWANLCYVSDGDVFVRNFQFLRILLCKSRYFALCYDARLLPARISRMSVRRKKTRQYRWKDGDLRRMDNLYSELVTFNKY